MIYDNLLEPQKVHAKTLLDSIYLNGFAFDASPTGTGKTYTACSVAKNLNLPVVVVCPKVSRKNWRDVMALYGVKPFLIINYEKMIRGNTPYYKYDNEKYVNRKNWYESTGIIVNLPKNALVIVDECHKCKGAKSKNGHLLTALANNQMKVLLLSATAGCNVTDMRHFGYATRLHIGSDWRRFAKEHGAVDDGYGGLKMQWDENTLSGMQKLHNTLFNTRKCASKMNIKDFGNIFPENRIIAESFDLGSDGSQKLQAVYDKMEYELAQLDARAENYSEHVFAVMMRARRQSELLKVPVTAEWIEDRMDEGISPVVFFNFSDSLQAVEARISTKFKGLIAKVVGGQSDDDRDKNLDEFQNNIKRIQLANMSAGAASISMHDLDGNYPRNSLLCPSWSAILTLQAIGRIYRANGKSPCLQKFLFASDIEEQQRARVALKIRNISELNDGDLSMTDSIPFYNTP
jgi:hypothetical protein